jgi:hypothetical protein
VAQPDGVRGGGNPRLGGASRGDWAGSPRLTARPCDYAAVDLNGAEMQVAAYPWPSTLLDELVERTRPHLICSAGRGLTLWRALHRARRRHHTVTVMLTDNIWFGRPRQRALQLLFVPLRHSVVDAAYVPGVRSTEYVNRLGFSGKAVLAGVFTLDAARFAEVATGSASAAWLLKKPLTYCRGVPDLPGERGRSVAAVRRGTRFLRRWPTRDARGHP